MMQARSRLPHADPFAFTVLLPVMGAVLTCFLSIGIALPVLPLYVHQRLGFETFVVGLVAGSQFAAAVITRIWAGSFADNRGGKRAVIAGLLAAAASGVLSLLSFVFIAMPPCVGRLPAAGPGAARRRRKLHHYGRRQLGPFSNREPVTRGR